MSEKAIIYGKDGFIGKALARRDLPAGLYLFDSPSSIVLFDKEFDWCVSKTVDDFLRLLARIRRTGEYLVFPSSATVYNRNTSYAHTKAAIEELFLASGLPGLCLRISAGYGPGEAHKGDFASVVYQWTKGMMKGEQPIIYGDGTQTRDFIYEDDIAMNIEQLAKKHTRGIYDIGTGHEVSFNELVSTINEVLGTKIQPIYVPKPKNYVPSTPVRGVPTRISLYEGIRAIADSLKT